MLQSLERNNRASAKNDDCFTFSKKERRMESLLFTFSIKERRKLINDAGFNDFKLQKFHYISVVDID